MDFGLTEEQEQLKSGARDFLSNECPPSVVRKVMAEESGLAPELYKKIAELGWTGMIVPEEFGGLGLGMLDLAVLLEECGYAAMPGPFPFSAGIAASALRLGGSPEQCKRWLPDLAAGRVTGTVAIVEESDSLDPADIALSAARDGAGFVLSGVKMFVPYAHAADFMVVAARSTPGPDGLDFFVVEGGASGLGCRILKNVDQTRRVCEVKFDRVKLPEDARLPKSAGLLDRLIDAAAVVMASDCLGGSERALEMAVEYSKVREQFGRPIGSFQALQHLAAELIAGIEPARSLLWYAAYGQDAGLEDASRAASMAKARLSAVYSRTADQSVLMHGGIGFTWEHDIHLWFKRARFDDPFFGDPVFHRDRVATLSGY
ncbi:MAG TPA: acyl-CoA dehydrogenase family protein [Candidatus Binataceae bacterium]|jgi:alkylation response protein AidB-like acyl-CoA dehydrogenase|nr:acyl-CoA dehydrogenase family protein [Candidatus Binataceae bacterium]